MNSACSRLTLLGLLTLVGGIGFLAAQWPVDVVEHSVQPARWVRTARGWEKAAWLEAHSPSDPALHPGFLAAMILGASATSLIVSHASARTAGSHEQPIRPTLADSKRTAPTPFDGPDRRRSERRTRDRRVSSS